MFSRRRWPRCRSVAHAHVRLLRRVVASRRRASPRRRPRPRRRSRRCRARVAQRDLEPGEAGLERLSLIHLWSHCLSSCRQADLEQRAGVVEQWPRWCPSSLCRCARRRGRRRRRSARRRTRAASHATSPTRCSRIAPSRGPPPRRGPARRRGRTASTRFSFVALLSS